MPTDISQKNGGSLADQAFIDRYDWSRSYEWNYLNPPTVTSLPVPDVPGHFHFLGKKVASPLGVAAGPLLNGHWVLYYASLGFDVLTYKTVRSRERTCYEMPNLLPVRQGEGFDWNRNRVLLGSEHMDGSWAVSFGMPSRSPDFWTEDIAWTRKRLSPEKLLSVSVVATPEASTSLSDLAMDYARTAELAVESGADVIEANFSCPNVDSPDGQLYQNPDACVSVAKAIRERIGEIPLILKIGELSGEACIVELFSKLENHAQAFSMINCLAARVNDEKGNWFFQGAQRGIAGPMISSRVVEQVTSFTRIKRENKFEMEVISVGGIRDYGGIQTHLNLGAHAVHVATAAMLNTRMAIDAKSEWANEFVSMKRVDLNKK